METMFINSPFINEQEDSENSPENSGDSPRSTMLNDGKMACTSSPRKSNRRSIEKRVVSVPIKDVEGSRPNGEMGAPPSDSWAWRKYGQKPIKGSPYPRGYYRCSSSKGCPARKQVERSRIDPNMLVVTYSCEHNHPWPAPRNHNQHKPNQNNPTSINLSTRKSSRDAKTNSRNSDEEEEEDDEEEKPTKLASQYELNCEEKFGNLGEVSSISSANIEFGWFSEFECTTSPMLVSPILTEERVTDSDMALSFTMQDEDESFFADLGELPECSSVFCRGMMEREEEGRRHGLTPCGTTG